jgi:hypothetical protein
MLFEGQNGSLEADLTGSPGFGDLASWQASPDDPGQDAHSVQGSPAFDAPVDPVGLPADETAPTHAPGPLRAAR